MRRLALLAPLLLASACTDTGSSDVDMPGFDEFADGKVDSGYLGSRSAEIQATFTGTVRVALAGKTPAELQAIADALTANPQDWNYRDVIYQVTQQAKFARNALRAAKYTLNLEGGEPTFTKITVEAGGLLLAYEVKIESLVKYKELEAQHKTPADLVGQKIDMKLPIVPEGLIDRVGIKCASDFDANGAAVEAGELRADNMFYYWDPARTGCTLKATDLADGKYTVTSSSQVGNLYPEYDKLIKDGKITMVSLFGQIEHGDLSPSDWGFRSYSDVRRTMVAKGFKTTKTFPNNTGERLEKTMPNGLKVEFDMLSPVNFADHVDRDKSNGAFRDAIRSHELVYYAGHAFYGSLTVLDEPTAYPKDTYQIIFMDACWSYAYYTKQVFRNKATAADPTGFVNTDVVNNTEMGITGSELTAMVLFDNVFKGADAVKGKKSAVRYSWNNLVKYMNEHAQRRAEARGEDNAEIYGVSGVTTNKFKP